MVRVGVKIPQDGNCANRYGHVATVHGHVWRTLCSVCGTRDGQGSGSSARQILIEEGGRGAKSHRTDEMELDIDVPVCNHVSGCFIFFITNKSNTATPTMKKMY